MLSNNLVYTNPAPVTQSVEAVVSLLKSLNREFEPLPKTVKLGESCVLVLSRKKDAYYVTTPKACSCPSATYRRGMCKHQREHFPADGLVLKNRARFCPSGPLDLDEELPGGFVPLPVELRSEAV